MRNVVADTSCIVDLRKAHFLELVFALPYVFVVPDTLFEDEWLSLAPSEKKTLRDKGLEVRELPGASVERAARYFNQHRRLKLNDCFALALSEDIEDSILLTGDGPLRRVAEQNGVEVRGVLWTIDELEKHAVVSVRTLLEALRLFRDDVFVFLPEAELVKRIRRLTKLL